MFYTSKVIKSFEKKNIIRTQMFKLKIYIAEIFFIILIPEVKHLCLWR